MMQTALNVNDKYSFAFKWNINEISLEKETV